MPRLKTTIKPEMAVQMNLEAHERECVVRYQAVQDKLDSLDKRMATRRHAGCYNFIYSWTCNFNRFNLDILWVCN